LNRYEFLAHIGANLRSLCEAAPSNPIQVLLAVEPRLLRDALQVLLARHARITVLNVCRDLDLMFAPDLVRSDVVVATLEPVSGVPPLVMRLLAEFPGLLVVNIELCAERARIFSDGDAITTIPQITAAAIVRAILRGASQRGEPGRN
jgi:hypothetical protein